MSIFRKSLENIQVLLKYDKNNRHIKRQLLYTYDSYLNEFFLEWEMCQTEGVEEVKAHISCSIILSPRKSCRLSDNVEKYGIAGQATD
jgi:hypothetical protein